MWKIINRGNGIDIYVGGVKCYLAPNSITKTNNTKLLEAARKVRSLRVTEEFGDLSRGELRKLASQRGIKNYSKFKKKELIEKLSEVKINGSNKT